MNERKIFLVKLTVFDKLVYAPERLGGLGANDYTARVSVNSVTKRGNEGVFVFRVIIALFTAYSLFSSFAEWQYRFFWM